jgi:pimeloyl-ACP methyl ester carboxylesterase
VRSPELKRARVNGIELAYFEWGRPRTGERTILLVHATGFHARCWDQVVHRLGDRHVIAVDQRGHGRSEQVEIEHWRVFGRDLAGLVRELDLRDVVGVGHSMGGHAVTEGSAACQDRFVRVLLIDPVIASPGSYDEGGWVVPEGGVHPVSKRKNRFASPEAMFERFEQRHPYSLFDRAVLRDYCQHGLFPVEGGEWILACPPSIEASVYMTIRTNPGVYDSIRSLELPVRLLRAPPASERTPMSFAASATWPELIGEFQRGEEVFLPDHTHFIAHEDPGLVADHIEELASS